MESNNKGYNIVLAAGGTGGHLFPAIAIADAIMEISPESRCLFIASGKDLEKRIISSSGYDMDTISISGIAGLGIFKKIKALTKLPIAVLKSAFILKKFGADVVIGMGSYTAGPVLMAAKLIGVKTAIHEQNRRPGITNKMMSGRVGRVYSSFEDTFAPINSEKNRYLGNPVRKDIVSFSDSETALDRQDTSNFKILVLGGSQGSRSVNRAVSGTVEILSKNYSVSEKIEFVHQTGQNDLEDVKTAYENSGIKAEVQAFYKDMAQLYSWADLLICRAGASTVAEITVMGKPAIFIPFPAAAGGHQSENAEALEEAGAAIVLEEKDLSPLLLAEKISNLMDCPEKIKEMGNISRSFGKPGAAKEIANDIISWIESKI